MSVKKLTSTGYQPPGSVYFAPSGGAGVGSVSTFYVIRLDDDGVPYYVAY